ncbi:MAG: hypothetical protein HZA31_08915 [Opitutae bacterium]|nr:hypothetical protein [Opitutae bacterium]
MWQKFKEQLPAIVLTAALVIAAAFWLNQKTVQEMDAMNQAKMAEQRQQFEAQLKASAEDTRRQIDSVDKLLKDAIQKRAADVFMTDEEIAKLNADKVNQLAEAIAKKVQPYNPLPKTPEEAEKIQNEQVDKVSSRMAQRIQPILAEMSRDQNLTREQIDRYSQRISDQIGVVLTAEMAKNQQLNNNLISTQVVARESLALSHEVTALYLSSFKDQGLLTRLLTLPANVVRDVSKMSIVNSTERKKIEEELIAKMSGLEKKLSELEAQQPKK